MPFYKFKVHDSAGSENLGAAVLTDDGEALAFAERVMQELMRLDAKLYATWTMEITVDKRSVASIPFEPAQGLENQMERRDLKSHFGITLIEGTHSDGQRAYIVKTITGESTFHDMASADTYYEDQVLRILNPPDQ
jgi:hypothetical protein